MWDLGAICLISTLVEIESKSYELCPRSVRWEYNRKKCAPTSAVAVAEIGKSPDIAESHGVSKERQQKIKLSCPLQEKKTCMRNFRSAWETLTMLEHAIGKTKLFIKHVKFFSLYKTAEIHYVYLQFNCLVYIYLSFQKILFLYLVLMSDNKTFTERMLC